jgi:hypothetical protein
MFTPANPKVIEQENNTGEATSGGRLANCPSAVTGGEIGRNTGLTKVMMGNEIAYLIRGWVQNTATSFALNRLRSAI